MASSCVDRPVLAFELALPVSAKCPNSSINCKHAQRRVELSNQWGARWQAGSFHNNAYANAAELT